MSSNPKYGRRKVRIDPRLQVPPGIADVEYDDTKSLTNVDTSGANNGYNGGVSRDDRPTNPTTPNDPSPVTSGSNAWGIAKVKSQELVINSDGQLVVEVTFELPNWSGGYISRVSRT